MANILALDPAARCGWAWSNGFEVESGSADLGVARELGLRDLLCVLVQRFPVEAVVYELGSFGSRFAHVQRRHNELSGAIMLTAQSLGLECWSLGPSQWKKAALGRGNAKKEDVVRLLSLMHRIDVPPLGNGKPDFDRADAIGIVLAARAGKPMTKKAATKALIKKLAGSQTRLFGKGAKK